MNYKSSKVIHYWARRLNGVACRTGYYPANKWPATTLTKNTTCKRCIATSLYKKWKLIEDDAPQQQALN